MVNNRILSPYHKEVWPVNWVCIASCKKERQDVINSPIIILQLQIFYCFPDRHPKQILYLNYRGITIVCLLPCNNGI